MLPETPIFSKTYDWSLWLFAKTAGFPKRFRHTLTERLERDTLELERLLVTANYARHGGRAALLDEADAVLQGLRLNVRRSHDLRCLAGGSYEYASESLSEIGRLLGAWKKGTAGSRS